MSEIQPFKSEVWAVKNGTVTEIRINDNRIFQLKKPLHISNVDPLLKALDIANEYIGKPQPQPIFQPPISTIKLGDVVSDVSDKPGVITNSELLLLLRHKYNNIPFTIKELLKEPSISLSKDALYARLRKFETYHEIESTLKSEFRNNRTVFSREYSLPHGPQPKLVEDLKYKQNL